MQAARPAQIVRVVLTFDSGNIDRHSMKTGAGLGQEIPPHPAGIFLGCPAPKPAANRVDQVQAMEMATGFRYADTKQLGQREMTREQYRKVLRFADNSETTVTHPGTPFDR